MISFFAKISNRLPGAGPSRTDTGGNRSADETGRGKGHVLWCCFLISTLFISSSHSSSVLIVYSTTTGGAGWGGTGRNGTDTGGDSNKGQDMGGRRTGKGGVRISDNSEWRLELVFRDLVIPSYDSYDFMSESFQKKCLNPKTRVFSHSPWNWRDSKL